MTAYYRNDEDIKTQFRRQIEVGNVLVRKFSFAPTEEKSNCPSYIVTQFLGVLFGSNHTNTLSKNLLSAIVTHSNGLLMSPDIQALV